MADKVYRDKKIEHKFQHLWCKAIGTKNYDKEEWIEMEKELMALVDKAKRKMS